VLEFHTLDVFTQTPFSGNPLAVVLGADDLTPAQMQTIAREFNLSETIFVQTARDPNHTARVRIFFPTAEIPFAGHPTIGCAIHLAAARHKGDFTAHLVLEEEAGRVPVTVTRNGDLTEAEFTAPVTPYATAFTAPAEMVAAALGLPETSIGFDLHTPNVWQGGPRFAYAPLKSLQDLATARPIEPHWSALMAHAGVDSLYLYTRGEVCDFRARLFSPTAGIPEDPATGSASAILAAQLLSAGELSRGTSHFTLHQGVEMGRPSLLHIAVDAGETLQAVRVRGAAVAISQGRITIPQAPLGNSQDRA
jgi:trans-2,3-dihydro-3-hydroxyanthranilate isomerase